MKRTFDLIFSGFGLLVLSPLLLITAVCVRIYDGGAILFKQKRVGLNGKAFKMLKFRSMIQGADRIGSALTVGNDGRITPLGHILRRSKFDELPQLWNVLVGQMSLVGPRPEIEKFVTGYTPEQRQVLELMPGITDPASFAFFEESEVLGRVADPEKFYREVLVGEKIRINLEYAEKANLFTDLVLILATIARAVGFKFDVFAWLKIARPELKVGL